MGLWSGLYERALRWAAHPRAPWYLAALGFAESSFFPVPPDVMLAPMVLARPQAAWRLAALTTAASVAGGLAGYAIGALALEAVRPWLEGSGSWEAYLQARAWFGRWGVWAVLAAGFSPIPYKLFTLAAGALGMPLLPFALASLVGRGGRFFLVAALMHWGGAALHGLLKQYVDRVGWALVAALAAAWLLLR